MSTTSRAPGEDLERLRLLASTIAGRSVEVAALGSGELPWTDGITIHLRTDDDRPTMLRALALQASLLAAGSLTPDALRPLARRQEATRRYLAVEGHRALALNERLLPGVARSVIDHEIASSVDDAAASLDRALGREVVAAAPACFGEIRPRAMARAARGDDAGGGSAAPAVQARRGAPANRDGADEDEAPDDQQVGQLLSSPVGGGGPVGRLLARLLRRGRGRGTGAPGADAPTTVGSARSGPSRGVTVSTKAAPGSDERPDIVRHGATYPEWNVHRQQYRADWCTVTELEAPLDDHTPRTSLGGVELRRPLGRLGMGLERCRRQPDGDDIDIDAAVEAHVESVAGTSPDGAMYVQSLRRRRDLSVLILLDVSGSAREPGPAGRPVHEYQREAAAALTTTLHDLGDRVALYAFNSQGRGSVRMMRVKGFDEHLDGLVVRRLDGLVPGAYTRLGAAIRHGTSVVEERGGTSRRLLVVVSDGLAYDHGYEGRYGESDSRRALLEARRRGVGCVCLSVGADLEAAALRRVFGTAAHASVPTPRDLPPIIGPLFRSALASAEAQRRVFQRVERSRGRLELERSVS